MNLKQARARKQPDAVNSQNVRVDGSSTHLPNNAHGNDGMEGTATLAQRAKALVPQAWWPEFHP